MKIADYQSGVYCMNYGWKFLEITAGFRQNDDEAEESTHSAVYDATKGGMHKGPASGLFDDCDWERVTLPHDWVTRKDFDETQPSAGGYKERGVAWYRINFSLSDNDRDKQILIEFEGMSADATVYVNGFIMKHSFSGYTPFAIDITDVANFGLMPNTLAVHIDARGWEGWWYEGAGIYRNCWLVKKPAVHIVYDGAFIKPVLTADGWIVEIKTEIENSFEITKKYILSAEISNAEGKSAGTASGGSAINGFSHETLELTIPVKNPTLWDIEDPYLYTAELTVESEGKTDYIKIVFGFRTVSVCSKKGFFLNGRNVKLHGMCNHQDHAGVGVAVPYAIKEYRVKLLQEMGANAYRCAHNTDPEILDICDRLGMLVMEENRTFSPSTDAVNNVELMVRHSRNHPCVVMYSLFNEEPTAGSYKGRLISGRLRAAIEKHDDSRLITAAMNGGYMEPGGAVSILDVAGINYHPQGYAEFHEKFPEKPLVGSETTSSFSVRGEWKTDHTKNTISGHDLDCASWSQSVRTAWKHAAINDFVMGVFVWTGFDYRGEPTPFPWPSVSSFFGTYDSCGFAKDPVFLYKALWRKEPVIHIVPHWNLPVPEGTEVNVRVYTNCDSFKVYLNGRFIDEYYVEILEQTLFTIPYEKGEITAVGYINGAEAARAAGRTTKEAAYLGIELSKDIMTADRFDAIAVNVAAYDEDGLFVPTAQHLVQFFIAGAHIIGVGNGNQNSHEPDLAGYRHLFNGRCQAIIRNDGNSTDVSVLASAVGLKAANVTINTVIDRKFTFFSASVVDTKVITGWKMFNGIFDEMPDPDISLASDDNNSFVPVVFDYDCQALLDNKYGKYALYRAECDLGRSNMPKSLCFDKVTGVVWIYMNGELVKEEDHRYGGRVEIEITNSMKGRYTITVILRHMHEYWAHSGIYNPVIIKEYN